MYFTLLIIIINGGQRKNPGKDLDISPEKKPHCMDEGAYWSSWILYILWIIVIIIIIIVGSKSRRLRCEQIKTANAN